MHKNNIQTKILSIIETITPKFNSFSIYDDNTLFIKIFSSTYKNTFILLKIRTDIQELYLYKDNILLHFDSFNSENTNSFINLFKEIINGSVMFITENISHLGSTTTIVKVNELNLNNNNLALSFIMNPDNTTNFIWQ